jgi:hypothetical protein
MNALTSITRTAAVLGALALGHVSVGIATASRASEIDHFQRTAIETGVRYEKPECLALPYSVWINVRGTNFCVRYYFALGTTKPREAIVYFDGDVGIANGFKIKLPPDWRAQDTEQLQGFADGMRPYTGATSIYFGRMGLSGSSGHHGLRRTPLEVEFANRALDIIKAKYEFDTIHLVGQSGGTRVILGLMASRNDVGCVTLGAGVLLLPPDIRARNLKAAAPYREFDPEENLDPIVTHSKGRIFVVSDSQDVHTSVRDQTRFANLMQERGIRAVQIIVHASDRDHHDVIPFSMGTIYDCVNGLPTGTITRRGQ